MHSEAIKNMQKMIDKHLKYYMDKKTSSILEIGSRFKGGSYINLFKHMCRTHCVSDIRKGPIVTHRMPGPYTLPFKDNLFSLILSGQMLEHCVNPFRSIAEMKRVTKKGGLLALSAPSRGPMHTFDCWRFQRDAWNAIASETELEIIDQWIDEEGVWGDNMCLLRKPPLFLENGYYPKTLKNE